MFGLITIAREFGSGGAAIASTLAHRLGWRLLDGALISEAAKRASVSPELARAYDERLDSWAHRVAKRALWHGGIESVAAVSGRDFFDAEEMAALTGELIAQAGSEGGCVIVGRGGQCRLQGNPQAFHVFIYGNTEDKVQRVRRGVRGAGKTAAEIEELLTATDKVRSDYTRTHFQRDWKDPLLYHLMINSGVGDERTIAAILAASGLPGSGG
jgi:cytidylate kinase